MQVKLSEILDLQNGFAFNSSDYIDRSNTYNCRMSNIRPGGEFDIDYNPKYLPDIFSDSYSQFLLKDGDLIVAMTDLANDPKILGVPAIVKTQGKKLLLNQRVGKLVIKDHSRVHIPFLKHALNRKEVQKYYSKFSSGGLQINLGKNDLLSYSFHLPSMSVQKFIATILDKADTLRKKDKQLFQYYDDLAQSLFIDMFGDPVTNEKGWEEKKMSQLGRLDRGVSKHRPRNAPELLGGKYPLVQTGDVANSGGIINSFKSTYSEIGLKQSKLWPKGTLCITIAANIAKTGILNFEACFPDSIVGFVPNILSNNCFIQFWFQFLQKILEDAAPESAQKNINLDILRNLDVIAPPITLQNKFAQQIQNIEQQKEKLKAQMQESENLFQALLQKLLVVV